MKSIEKTYRTHKLGFALILCIQAGTLIAAYFLGNHFSREFGFPAKYVPLAVAAIAVIYLTRDIPFFVRKILRFRQLLHAEPIRCRLEDFLLVGYTNEGQRRFNVYPIVRSLRDGKLYITYGNYCMAGFNATYTHLNKSANITVLRNDNSPVDFGDPAYLYIQKLPSVSVEADERANVLRIGKKELPFLHQNPKFTIRQLHNATLFQGAVEFDQ